MPLFQKETFNDLRGRVSGLEGNYRANLRLALAPRVESMFKTGVKRLADSQRLECREIGFWPAVAIWLRGVSRATIFGAKKRPGDKNPEPHKKR